MLRLKEEEPLALDSPYVTAKLFGTPEGLDPSNFNFGATIKNVEFIEITETPVTSSLFILTCFMPLTKHLQKPRS